MGVCNGCVWWWWGGDDVFLFFLRSSAVSICMFMHECVWDCMASSAKAAECVSESRDNVTCDRQKHVIKMDDMSEALKTMSSATAGIIVETFPLQNTPLP